MAVEPAVPHQPSAAAAPAKSAAAAAPAAPSAATMPAAPAGRLSRLTKLAFGFGDSGMSATSTIIGLFFLYYLTDVAGIRPALAGAAILAGRFYDAVTDPFEGYLSDRTLSRWGRRRPYFLFGALPFGLTFAAMFLCPALPSQGWRTAFAGMAYILHMTAFTGIGVPYTSLTAELTRDYDERTSLTAYRMAFSIVFGLVAAALPPIIVAAFPGDARLGYAVMAGIFGAFTVLPPLVVFFGCKERAPSPRSASPSVAGGLRGFLHEMLLTLQNRPFRVAVGVYLVTWVAVDLLQVTFVYFLQYVMGMEASSSVVFALLFVTAALCLPLWVWVSERWSKKVAYALGIGFMALILCGVAFLRPGMATAVFTLAVLAGVGLSAAHVIPWSMIPDCIEYDELRTGRRREGQHYGFMTFAQKLASSGAIFLTGVALDASGYVPLAAQGPATLLVMRLLLGPAPALILGFGVILVLFFYPVDRSEHARIRAELEARKKEGQAACP